jgi:prepilin-type N-terminal cleavage/methylation domain-containing protein
MMNSSKILVGSINGEESGFTFIEMLTALVLLTIGLLGTAVLTTGVVRGNVAARNVTTATAIAQSCFEENRRVGYSSAGSVPSSGANNCITGNATVVSGGVTFTRNLAIDTSVTNIKTLTVILTWSEGAVGTKSVTLKTIMAAS